MTKYRVIYLDENRIPDIVECDKLWSDNAAYSFLNEGRGSNKWDCVCSVPIANIHKIEKII